MIRTGEEDHHWFSPISRPKNIEKQPKRAVLAPCLRHFLDTGVHATIGIYACYVGIHSFTAQNFYLQWRSTGSKDESKKKSDRLEPRIGMSPTKRWIDLSLIHCPPGVRNDLQFNRKNVVGFAEWHDSRGNPACSQAGAGVTTFFRKWNDPLTLFDRDGEEH